MAQISLRVDDDVKRGAERVFPEVSCCGIMSKSGEKSGRLL